MRQGMSRGRWAQRAAFGLVVIQEAVEASLTAAFRCAAWLLDRIDATQRLTHIAPAVTFSGAEWLVWRTHSEQEANPNS